MRSHPEEPKHGKECKQSFSGFHNWELSHVDEPAQSYWVCKCGTIKIVKAPEIIREGF